MNQIETVEATLPNRKEIADVLKLVAQEAAEYLNGIDSRPVISSRVVEAASTFDEQLPDVGVGAAVTLRKLIHDGLDATATTAGPRCFHFVIGGVTPAALGADWFATLTDQPAYAWVSSPLGVHLELLCLRWLKDLFGLSHEWGGLLTTGATMANFAGLAAARQWWGERHGHDIAEHGLSGLPTIPVFSSGYLHASAAKALGMLGIGRGSARRFARDGVGRLDMAALERALDGLDGEPAIVVANAGEVNAGDFDPIDEMADLAEQYDAWLHVDGAFGLFARVTPNAKHLARGVERAHSVTVDGHKWLNAPYDSGISFVRDATLLGRAFANTAAYLPDPDDPQPTLGNFGPENSRRARGFAVWATLRAYGREGYRVMVEGHLALAQRLARQVDDAPELERLADVPLNIVCFRYNPGDREESALNALNERLGRAVLDDGRVYAGTTLYDGKVALRPAIVNWRTREGDIDYFVDVVRSCAEKL